MEGNATMSESRVPQLTGADVAQLLVGDAAAWLRGGRMASETIELGCVVTYRFSWGSVNRVADQQSGLLHDVLTVKSAFDDGSLPAWTRTPDVATYVSDDPRWQPWTRKLTGAAGRIGVCTDWSPTGVQRAIQRNTDVTRRVLVMLGLANRD